jgi:hypothetical protein
MKKKGVYMQVNPIGYNAQTKSASFTGCFYSKPVFESIETYPAKLKAACEKRHLTKANYCKALDESSETMKSIMAYMKSNFSKSTQLTAIDRGDRNYTFALVNPLSDYVHPIKSGFFREFGSPLDGIESLKTLYSKLKEVNNYEVELKMCKKRHKGANFEDFVPTLDLDL